MIEDHRSPYLKIYFFTIGINSTGSLSHTSIADLRSTIALALSFL